MGRALRMDGGKWHWDADGRNRRRGVRLEKIRRGGVLDPRRRRVWISGASCGACLPFEGGVRWSFLRQSTGMRLIARPAVTTFNEGEQLLTSVSDPVLSSGGEVLAFFGKVKSGSITLAAVIAAEREGEPRVIASAGMQAPGLPSGVVFKTFKSLAAPSGVGGPIFVAGLGGNPGYGQSLWAVDRHGDLRCVLRAGEMIDEDRVVSFRILEAVNGNSGSTRAFNDNRELVWLATFERGASAIVKTTLP